MDNLKIKIGDIIKNARTSDRYRVIYIGNGFVGLCKVNTNKLEISYPTAKGLGLNIRNNVYELISEDGTIFDESSVPATFKLVFCNYKISALENNF